MLETLVQELGCQEDRFTVCIGGALASGKTALACQLALAIASGNSWLEASCAKGRVLICSIDADHGYLDRMLDKQMEMLGIPRESVADTLLPPVELGSYLMIHFDEEAALAHIREVLKYAGELRCIVLDADCGPSATILDGLIEDTIETGTSLVWTSMRLLTANRAQFILSIDDDRQHHCVKELHCRENRSGDIESLMLAYDSPIFSLAVPEPLSAEARLAKQIHTARSSRYPSIYKAAGVLDVSVALLERWETGRQVPDALELKRISDTFEVPVEELLS